MKICIFTGKADIRGGSTRYVTDIAEGLQSAGHTVDILVHEGKFLKDLRNIRRYAQSHDIVQVVDLNPRGFIAYLATRFTKARFVIIVQGSYSIAPLDNIKTALLARIVYRSAAAVVAISSYSKHEIEKRMHGANITVISHGVDLAKFQPVSRERSINGQYILGVGSIKRRKGYETALRAFIEAKKEIPELHYVIVGAQIDEPKYVQRLMEIARVYGVSEQVHFIKDISDEELRELYQHAEVFILTSTNEGGHFEGFGLVFLEAACYGVPAIGTKGNGIEDAVIDEETGILVPQHDTHTTAHAIVRLMQNDELRKRLGVAARRHAEERTWSHVIKEYEILYKKILSQK